MKTNPYYYAVTRIHSNEAELLSDQAVERMRQADSFAECLRILKEHDWTTNESMGVQEIIDVRQRKTWAFLFELIGNSDLLDFFRYEHDFNNLKAAIRLRYTKMMDKFGERYFSAFGTLSPQVLKDITTSGSFDRFPELLAQPASEANRVLLQTGNAQFSDAILDRACLEVIHTEAKRQGGVVLKRCAETKADIANMGIVIRGLKMNQTESFFEMALTERGSLSKSALCTAVPKGVDAIYAYLSSTQYADCLGILEHSLSFFQAEVESRLIEEIKPQKSVIGGIDAIFAFVIAKENELSAVRLLLSSKLNHFPEKFVSSCLRRMYA